MPALLQTVALVLLQPAVAAAPAGPPPLSWFAGFSSDMVLQATSDKGVAVYGLACRSQRRARQVPGCVALSSGAKVSVTAKSSQSSYTVQAVITSTGGVNGSAWRAVLKPAAASHEEWTITASSATTAGAGIVLERVVFGDVYLCSGRASPLPTPNHPLLCLCC